MTSTIYRAATTHASRKTPGSYNRSMEGQKGSHRRTRKMRLYQGSRQRQRNKLLSPRQSQVGRKPLHTRPQVEETSLKETGPSQSDMGIHLKIRDFERRAKPNHIETSLHFQHKSYSHIRVGTSRPQRKLIGIEGTTKTPIPRSAKSHRGLPWVQTRSPRKHRKSGTSPNQALRHESQGGSQSPKERDPRQPHSQN